LLADDLAARAVPLSQLASDGLDLLIVAVSDPAIAEVAGELAERKQATVALHTSGSAGAEILAPLRANGTAVGSLHPLRAFASTLELSEVRGTFFAIDGDETAVDLALELARSWDGVAEIVPADRRVLYHLAATLAAGGIVTLLSAACRIAESAGIDPAVRDGYLALAQGALENVRTGKSAGKALEPAQAITGPAARGDAALLNRQLTAVAEQDERSLELFVAITRETIAALDGSGHTAPNAAKLQHVLERWESSGE